MVQKVNVTLDNVSPLINYSPSDAWHEGDSRDPSWQSYGKGTFTLTTQSGASASVTFNGTAVWVYGAKRGNHAKYNVTLDDKAFFDDGYWSPDEFQQVLFSGGDLGAGPHTMTITDWVQDAGRPYLDIDSIVYEVEVPDGYEKGTTYDDTASAFNFSSSQWGTNPDDLSEYGDGTGHTTSVSGAHVFFTFEGSGHMRTHHKDSSSDNKTGSSVEIYGAVGPTIGNYTVQIDGGQSVTFNGTKSVLTPQTLLYQDNSLVPGSHTVNISNPGGQTLSIDYAITYSLSTSGGSGGGSSSLSKGAIGGIAVGASAGVLLVLVGVFLWYRRRNRPGLIRTGDHSDTADYGTGPVTPHTPSLPITVERYPPLPVTTAAAAELEPPSTPPQSNSSASNADSRFRLIMHNPNPSLTDPAHDDILRAVLDLSPGSEDSRSHQNTPHTARPLPQPENPNSNQNVSVLPSLPGTDLRNVRMQVEGRSQDFGPIVFVPEPEHDGNLLPPDYYQATEPFPPLPR